MATWYRVVTSSPALAALLHYLFSMKTLLDLISSRYGVNGLSCDALVVEWAATVLAETVGTEKAAKAWKRLNASRAKAGRYTSIPKWGTAFWGPYFGTAS